MNLFNRLPGFQQSATGLEQRIWRRLPAILLRGTLLPLAVAGASRLSTLTTAAPGSTDGALLLWEYTTLGIISLHWTLVLTVALGCFIVRVMKGPAYVADAYALPQQPDDGTDGLPMRP